MPKTDVRLLTHAKAMRTEMTPVEARLWYHLRGRRFHGIKFTRQVVIGPYIADFVARTHRLVVEVDGDTHTDHQRDARRTAWLEQQGYRVIRFSNSEVMVNEDGVLQLIVDAIRMVPLPDPLPRGEREASLHPRP